MVIIRIDILDQDRRTSADNDSSLGALDTPRFA